MPAIVSPIIPVFVAAAIATIITPIILMNTIAFLITWDILLPIPVVPHKVDTLATGIVSPAMLAPILGMSRRYAQINRFPARINPADHSGLTVDQLRRRIIANVEVTIKAGLADADRYIRVSGKLVLRSHTAKTL